MVSKLKGVGGYEKKILVVDNDRIILELISRFLKKNGYDVVCGSKWHSCA